MKWPRISVGEIAEIVGGSTPRRDKPEYWAGDIPWVTPTDLPMPGQGISEVDRTAEYISDRGLASSSAQLLPPGTVLFSSRATIGKLGIARVPITTNQGFANFIPKPVVTSRYLAYALQYFRADIARLAGTTTFKEVTKTAIKRFKVPLPSVSEQRRIVEILDQADALRRKRAEANVKAARILPALFYKMIANPGNRGRRLPTETLGKLVKVISGATPSKGEPGFWNGSIPWVSPKDMKQEYIYESIDHITHAAITASSLKLVSSGSVLIVVRGMILAHAVPIALAGISVTINQDMKALVPKDKRVSGEYLHGALTASRQSLLASVKTAAHGTKKLDTDDLLKMPIVVPQDDQHEAYITARKYANGALDGLATASRKMDRLFRALLYCAFSGELTAKWRKAHLQEILSEIEQQRDALTFADSPN